MRTKTASKVAVAIAFTCVATALSVGCSSGPTRITYQCPSGKRDWVSPVPAGDASLVVSGSVPSRIYLEKTNTSLYMGQGTTNFRWRKLASWTPGELEISSGRQRDVLFETLAEIFRSTDEGHSWKELTCGSPGNEAAPAVSSIAVPADDPSDIYMGASTPMDFAGAPKSGGFYRSTNGGKSWLRFTNNYYPSSAKIPPGYANLDVDSIAVNPSHPKTVYLGTDAGGILVSRNGGDSWSYNVIGKEPTGNAQLFPTAIAFGPGPHPALWVIVVDENIIYRGDELGRHWVRIELGRKWVRIRGVYGIAQVIPDQRNPNVVFARTYDRAGNGDPDRGFFLRSLDGGRHWSRATGIPPKTQHLVIQPSSDAYYAFSWDASRIFRSLDGGASWTKLPPLPK